MLEASEGEEHAKWRFNLIIGQALLLRSYNFAAEVVASFHHCSEKKRYVFSVMNVKRSHQIETGIQGLTWGRSRIYFIGSLVQILCMISSFKQQIKICFLAHSHVETVNLIDRQERISCIRMNTHYVLHENVTIHTEKYKGLDAHERFTDL